MLVAVAVIEDVQHILDFPDSTVYTRTEVYILDLGRYERQDGLGASPSNEQLLGRRGDAAWGSESVVGEERCSCGAEEEREECWI